MASATDWRSVAGVWKHLAQSAGRGLLLAVDALLGFPLSGITMRLHGLQQRFGQQVADLVVWGAQELRTEIPVSAAS